MAATGNDEARRYVDGVLWLQRFILGELEKAGVLSISKVLTRLEREIASVTKSGEESEDTLALLKDFEDSLRARRAKHWLR